MLIKQISYQSWMIQKNQSYQHQIDLFVSKVEQLMIEKFQNYLLFYNRLRNQIFQLRIYKLPLKQMSFHKQKPHTQQEKTFQREEQLYIFLRTHFVALTQYILQMERIKTCINRIQLISLLVLYILDEIFFRPLLGYLTLRNIQTRNSICSKQFEELIEILLLKFIVFDQIVLSPIGGCLEEIIKKKGSESIKDKVYKQKRKLLLSIKENFFPHSSKLVQIYKASKKKQQLSVSRSHSKYYITQEDYFLRDYLLEQINKMMEGLSINQLQRNTSIQKSKLVPKHSYHQFCEKILYYYRKAVESMNKFIDDTPNDQKSMITSLASTSSSQKSIVETQTSPTIGSIRKQSSINISRQSSIYKNSNSKLQRQTAAYQTNHTQKNKLNLKTQAAVNKSQPSRDINISVIQRPVPIRCLNCIQYFYKGIPIQIQRNLLVKYQILSSIKMIKQFQDNMRQHIAIIINEGGGTILFGCNKTKFGFVPIGQPVKLKEQESYISSFEHLLKSIRPQSYQKLIDYKIDFIPLKNPKFIDGKPVENNNVKQMERYFFPELYVMRIKLTPTSGKQLFGCQIDKITYYITRKNGNVFEIKTKTDYQKQIKRRRNRFSQIKSIQDLNKLREQLGQREYQQYVRGRRHVLLNAHEGKCMQTLTLSN